MFRHGSRYDYSKVIYKNTKTNVIIVCKKHGEFEQRPDHHFNGSGCKQCGIEDSHKKQRLNSKDFFLACENKHDGKYSYALDSFSGVDNPIKIMCPKHGVFEQRALRHKSGAGCKDCHLEEISVSLSMKWPEFLKRATDKHAGFYEYEQPESFKSSTLVAIKCPQHKVFHQRASAHLDGAGCRLCNVQKRLKPNTFFYLAVAKDCFKVGLTSNLKSRIAVFSATVGKKFKVVKTIKSDLTTLVNLEDDALTSARTLGLKNLSTKDGGTEAFYANEEQYKEFIIILDRLTNNIAGS